ncbi:zinc finger protein 679-like [Pectinophora gossypiella]|uniref:zinc finger protein 679-like n=1 Tax=Pectinophora gossypiella TaxID=13191 RepID=UPI00214E0B49|nr:zinc finger protein 679-like [Pectinophora gossypiella]
MEKNPLEIKISERKPTINKQGRPLISENVGFSPQPKSSVILDLLTRNKDLDQINELEDIVELEEKEFICKICSKRNDSEKEHKKHLQTHRKEQLFVCDFPNCSYSCKLSCNLIKHKRVHTSEKPYICDQCPFRTNFVNSLKVHKRIHTTERPYSCEYCAYRCNSSSNLKKHRMHRHTDTKKS